METRTYKVYKFSELPEKAQQKALDNLRDINTDGSFWYESLVDDMKSELAEIGFMDAEIFFSGFCSQGDGASFQCRVDLEKWFTARPDNKKTFPAMFAECGDIGTYHLAIKKSGHYEHEMTMSVDGHYYGEDDEVYKEFDILCDIVLEDARDEARDIYRRLEKEYDYQTSDEAITETIEANEYDFTEDGKID